MLAVSLFGRDFLSPWFGRVSVRRAVWVLRAASRRFPDGRLRVKILTECLAGCRRLVVSVMWCVASASVVPGDRIGPCAVLVSWRPFPSWTWRD